MNIKELTYYIQSANINFLIGSGASRPYLATLGSIEKSLKGAFGENRKLTPVMFDELNQSDGIQPGEILFVNWESVNKETNVMVRDSECSASLYEITRRTQEEFGLPIVVVIDEEHMF